jgi:hypothetical protein
VNGDRFEETGVRLRAINEATPGVEQYIREIARITEANERAAQSAQAVSQYFTQAGVASSGFAQSVTLAADATRKSDEATRRFAAGSRQIQTIQQETSRSFATASKQASKYGISILAVSGAAQSMGINLGAARKVIALTTGSMIGFGGPVGLAVVAITSLIAVTKDMLDYQKRLSKATDEAADSLLDYVRVTGVRTEAERIVIERILEKAQADLKAAEAAQLHAMAGEAELGTWRRLQIEGLQLLAIYAAMVGQYDAVREKYEQLQASWEEGLSSRDLAQSTAEIRRLEAAIEQMLLALHGGEEGLRAQEEAALAAAAAERERARALEASERRILAFRDAALAADVAVQQMALAGMTGDPDQIAAAEYIASEILNIKLAALEADKNARIAAAEEEKLTEAQKLAELAAIRADWRQKELLARSEYEQTVRQIQRAAAEEEKRAARARAEEEARQQHERTKRWHDTWGAWITLSVDSAAAIGEAIGATAAGSTSAWRQAGIDMIGISARAAQEQLAIWATAQAAIGNFAGAARAYAATAAIGLAAAAAQGYLQEMERQRSRSDNRPGDDYGHRTGPDIEIWDPGRWDAGRPSGSSSTNVRNTFSPSLTINASGTAASPGVWREDAQRWLDENMRVWEERQRLRGGRA